MEVSSERLVLRPLRASDLADLQRYATRPEFWRFLPLEPQTADSVAAYLEQCLAAPSIEQARGGVVAIEPREISHLVGTVRLQETSSRDRCGEIGYALDSDYWGRGYMTEAITCVLRFARERLSLHRVWATADVENEASWRLLERVGMQREGRLKHHRLVRGAWRDSYLYARILPSDERALPQHAPA